MKAFADMGGVLNETRVRAVNKWAGKARKDGPFLVTGWKRSWPSSDVVYRLARIKKDGTASSAYVSLEVDKVIILPEDQPQA